MMNSKTEQRAAATVADPRWAAVQARDAAADGQFFYAVRTTGVYCRPSCGARPARPENVTFHATTADAEAAGFRACKRCKPDQATPPAAQQQAMVTALCRWIEQADSAPTLDELAQRAQLSPHHLHRVFKAATGLTPRAYAAAQRANRVRRLLDGGTGTVTEAIYSAGFNTGSRFYAAADGLLGMTPSQYRAGGADTEIRFALAQCSLGALLVARSPRGICAISLGANAEALLRELQDRFPNAALIGADAAFEQEVAAVVGFVEAPRLGLSLPLDVRGTAFQQRVWQALRDIPAGRTATYTEVAALIGSPAAVRAVASACAANTLAIAIPCHRVVRQDGSLSGYRWGIERKRALLDRESA